MADATLEVDAINTSSMYSLSVPSRLLFMVLLHWEAEAAPSAEPSNHLVSMVYIAGLPLLERPPGGTVLRQLLPLRWSFLTWLQVHLPGGEGLELLIDLWPRPVRGSTRMVPVLVWGAPAVEAAPSRASALHMSSRLLQCLLP